MRNYLLTAVCGIVLGLAAGNAKAECNAAPDCTSLGYTKTESDCPYGSIKCPWNTSLVYCDSFVTDTPLPPNLCDLMVEVTVPANASCTGSSTACPGKCTEWSCNEGFIKKANACVRDINFEPMPSDCSSGNRTLICDGKEYCCPTSAGYTTCAQMNAGAQKCFMKAYQ